MVISSVSPASISAPPSKSTNISEIPKDQNQETRRARTRLYTSCVGTRLRGPPSISTQTPTALPNQSLQIVDYGEVFFSTGQGISGKFLNTPVWYTAPEILFQDLVGPSSDIWALACVLYNLPGSHELFESYDKVRDMVLVEMVCTFGKLPDCWWGRWEKRPDYSAEDGMFQPTSGFNEAMKKPMDLKVRLEDLVRGSREDILGPEEVVAFERILRGMLRFELRERISANEITQLLPSSWGIQRFGIGDDGCHMYRENSRNTICARNIRYFALSDAILARWRKPSMGEASESGITPSLAHFGRITYLRTSLSVKPVCYSPQRSDPVFLPVIFIFSIFFSTLTHEKLAKATIDSSDLVAACQWFEDARAINMAVIHWSRRHQYGSNVMCGRNRR